MKENKHLKTAAIAITMGAIWGIIEATLGSILHINAIADALGIFGSSTAIIVPIALTLIATCYKKAGNLRSVLYMGAVAVGIKAIACLILKQSFNPCMYMAIETLVMAGSCAAFRPTKVFSWKTYGTIAVGMAVYLTCYMVLTKYKVATLHKGAIGLTYTLIGGFVGYAIAKAFEKKNIKVNIDKFVFNPITASVLVIAALALTVVLK